MTKNPNGGRARYSYDRETHRRLKAAADRRAKDNYARGFKAAIKAAVAACVGRADRVLLEPPMPEEHVKEWRKALDGKTFNNTRSSASFDCADIVRAIKPPVASRRLR